MKIAYFCEPQVGGTFTFFKRIRPHLTHRGIDFRCVPPISREHYAGSPYDGMEGVEYVRFPENNPPEATRILIRFLEDHAYDAVLILPGTDIVCTNLVRYLPRRIRAVARVPMFTRGTYAPAYGLYPSLDMIIAVCHRIAHDLEKKHAIPGNRLRIVYNGVDAPETPPPRTTRTDGDPFRLLFAGRLTDSHKGIFLLPEIVRTLVERGIDAHMTVVGDGPDKQKLDSLIRKRRLEGRIELPGSVSLDDISAFLQSADCYVLPSRYEGCPNALLEAMAAGCACVVSRLTGSTDHLIEDGKSGYLAEVGSVASFSDRIARIAGNPDLGGQMGLAAHRRAATLYSMDRTADAYARAFRELMDMPDEREPARSLDAYDVPTALKPTWRTRVPDPLKNLARKWLERAGISS